MKIYTITIIVLMCIESVGMVMILSTGKIPPRTPKSLGFSLVANVVLIIWGFNVVGAA